MTSRAVVLANLASSNILEVDSTTDRVGIGSTQPTTRLDVSGNIKAVHGNFTGVVTATSFSGDGTNLTGVARTDFIVGTAITMTTGTFNGPVTIGGTLTYEDVTNIDSVGIITARSDISIADKIVHTNDTNTAIRFPANDTFAVETSGSEALRITSAGVVVVGHTAATTSGASNNSNFNIVGNIGSATGEGQLNLWKRTAPSADNVLGQINFCGDTTGDPGAVIKGEADLDWDQGGDTSDHPSRLTFFTVPDNSSVAAERLRITSAGKVGIDKTDPQSKLSIFDTSSATLSLEYDDGTAGRFAKLELLRNASQGAFLSFSEDTRTSDGFIVGTNNAAYPLSFQIGSSTKAKIDTSGRLLLGATSSSQNATIVAQGNSDNAASSAELYLQRGQSSPADGATFATILFGDSGGGQGAAILSQRDGGTWSGSSKPGRLVFSTTADGATSVTERLRITSGGNIGLGGITNPEDYNASANSLVSGGGITLANTTQGSIFFADSASGTGEYVGQINYFHSGNEMAFVNNNSECMRLLTNGNIGFNCTSRPSSGNHNGIFFDNNIITIGSDTSAGQDRMRFETPSGRVGAIQTSGNSTTYTTSSDYRLKENVALISDGLTRLKQLKPCRFNFIGDKDKTVDGFLAHEAQTVVPEAVTGTHNEVDGDGNAVMQGIDQSKLVPLLTAALQEAIAEIESLKTRVAALESS